MRTSPTSATFATPERNLVFDINDFDETLPGPWEWDVKRLAASLAVVARAARLLARERPRRVVRRAVARLPRAHGRVRAACARSTLWYDADRRSTRSSRHFPRRYRHLVRRDVARAQRKDHVRAVTAS